MRGRLGNDYARIKIKQKERIKKRTKREGGMGEVKSEIVRKIVDW
jgi:hypothetical protein